MRDRLSLPKTAWAIVIKNRTTLFRIIQTQKQFKLRAIQGPTLSLANYDWDLGVTLLGVSHPHPIIRLPSLPSGVACKYSLGFLWVRRTENKTLS